LNIFGRFQLVIVLSILLVSPYLHAQDLLEKYTAAVWKSMAGESLNYRHRAPVQVEDGEKYPLLLFLHGAGGRGDDNRGELTDAGTIQALEKAGVSGKFNSYVIAGQVPKEALWVDVDWRSKAHKMPQISPSMELMFEVLDAFVADPKKQIDRDRIYVMGLSMGGYGTWDAIQRRPDLFAAAVPICGGADNTLASRIAHVPIWAWHGDRDSAIPVDRSRSIVEAVKRSGGNPRYSEIKGRGHDSWVDAFNHAPLWQWIYSQKKRAPGVRFDPVKKDIEGWTVYVDPSLLGGPHVELGRDAIKMLANHLQRIKILVPEKQLKTLQTLEIWLERHHPTLGSMQYHPGGRWLRENGHDPRLLNKVHLPRAASLLSRQQILKHPAVILHELAHSYHDQVLGFEHEGVKQAYDRAMAAGKYQEVLLYTGQTVKHYGTTNEKEFFAEATEAYFYRNDFYPFVAAELEIYDPLTFSVLEQIWGKLR
jgi:dipeptidyl-peptidase-4